MIKWLFDWLRKQLGHYLLGPEEEAERRRDEERARKQRDIVHDDASTLDTANDLDSGEF